ncbi:MAG: division/cell wall cluster transcriptional repressor MraZ [Bifidobacteriaceae bacterium]|jgi:MraZ protein|nr:division/cell wall cluster transcriptional repressor MraZ [Bifidobacteriaceae bacterium]
MNQLANLPNLLLGNYNPRIDSNLRLILPAKFREQLKSGIVITPGQERCLYIWPILEFQTIYEKIKSTPLESKQARDFIRSFTDGAEDQIPDKQGRINIPPRLKDFANLGDWVVVKGAITRLEIWNPQNLEDYRKTTEEVFANISEEVLG